MSRACEESGKSGPRRRAVRNRKLPDPAAGRTDRRELGGDPPVASAKEPGAGYPASFAVTVASILRQARLLGLVVEMRARHPDHFLAIPWEQTSSVLRSLCRGERLLSDAVRTLVAEPMPHKTTDDRRSAPRKSSATHRLTRS